MKEGKLLFLIFILFDFLTNTNFYFNTSSGKQADTIFRE